MVLGKHLQCIGGYGNANYTGPLSSKWIVNCHTELQQEPSSRTSLSNKAQPWGYICVCMQCAKGAAHRAILRGIAHTDVEILAVLKFHIGRVSSDKGAESLSHQIGTLHLSHVQSLCIVIGNMLLLCAPAKE